MVTTSLPKFNMDNSETGCCPRFDPEGWDGTHFDFSDRIFVRKRTINFLHVPLNLGAVIKKSWAEIQKAGAAPTDEYLILSTDPSPWRGEHYFAVTRDVPDAEMVKLTGNYVAKVFEGPYRDAGRWAQEMEGDVKSRGQQLQKLFFFYTTCPRCARAYGKNYVVAFAEI